MNIVKPFDIAFQRSVEKHWDYIVVLVDIHDTIFEACWDNDETFKYFPYAKETLKRMSDREDIKMVLWSSSYPEKLAEYIKKFEEDNIHFDYVNRFIACNTRTGCFDDKMFFNVGIDNAFGFEPETDWEILFNYL